MTNKTVDVDVADRILRASVNLVQMLFCVFVLAANSEVLIRCEFTDSFCTLVQGTSDQFNWARGASTSSSGTGPSGDHTTGTGILSNVKFPTIEPKTTINVF